MKHMQHMCSAGTAEDWVAEATAPARPYLAASPKLLDLAAPAFAFLAASLLSAVACICLPDVAFPSETNFRETRNRQGPSHLVKSPYLAQFWIEI